MFGDKDTYCFYCNLVPFGQRLKYAQRRAKTGLDGFAWDLFEQPQRKQHYSVTQFRFPVPLLLSSRRLGNYAKQRHCLRLCSIHSSAAKDVQETRVAACLTCVAKICWHAESISQRLCAMLAMWQTVNQMADKLVSYFLSLRFPCKSPLSNPDRKTLPWAGNFSR